MRSRRSRAAGLTLAAPLLLALPSPTRPQYETFAGETAVVLVEVPVTVVYQGRALEGLRAEDFAVFDRGERQEVDSFEVLSVDPSAGAGIAGGPTELGGTLAARRNFLFLFDLAYADARSLAGAAASVERLLAAGLAPADRVGVGFFSAPRGFRWIVGLTERREDAFQALAVARAMIESDPPRVRELLDGWTAPSTVEPPWALPDREAIVAEAGLSGLNRGAAGWPTTSILRSLVQGLTRIAGDTAGLDGRKYLVHLSHGVPDWLVSGRSGERARVLGLLEEIKRACRSAGWAIHSVNLSGLGWGRDSLLMMAVDTGGQLFTNSNDVAVLVREMEAATRIAYLLTFAARDLEPDGGYHRLEVTVAGLPRGARVVHRPGYYAPKAR
ncbi:MAG TPA: VWA domain-containing protein [Thermoanaerobaculia bacterium]|nr:VWA domain-containing protein [Thermoanaerobaculia bacterium]